MAKPRPTVQSGKIYNIPAVDAAAMAGVSPETMKRYARTGKVDARKTFSGRWVFAADDLKAIQVYEVVA
jgi:predicted site-specific integrase-resolvase